MIRSNPFRAILITITFLALIGCNNSDIVTNANKQPDNPAEIKKIKNIFAEWQTAEIKRGHFVPADSCDPELFYEYTMPANLDSRYELGYGFPEDTARYKFSFGDLNGDNKLDGLVCFTPYQCNGGNGSIWEQWQVFLISNNDNYIVNDTLKLESFASTSFDSLGFYRLDSLATNRIYGKYFQFISKDAHCCPSINKPVTFDYTDKKLIYIGNNIE
jgi:hypothetical protein